MTSSGRAPARGDRQRRWGIGGPAPDAAHDDRRGGRRRRGARRGARHVARDDLGHRVPPARRRRRPVRTGRHRQPLGGTGPPRLPPGRGHDDPGGGAAGAGRLRPAAVPRGLRVRPLLDTARVVGVRRGRPLDARLLQRGRQRRRDPRPERTGVERLRESGSGGPRESLARRGRPGRADRDLLRPAVTRRHHVGPRCAGPAVGRPRVGHRGQEPRRRELRLRGGGECRPGGSHQPHHQGVQHPPRHESALAGHHGRLRLRGG